FLLHQFALEPACVLDRRAWTEIIELEQLAKLDLAFRTVAVRRGAALGPVDRLLLRVDLDQPVTGDQLLRLGERSVDDGGPSAGEFYARPFRAGLQTRKIKQDSGLAISLLYFV